MLAAEWNEAERWLHIVMTLCCKDRLSYTAALLVYPDMVHDVKWHNTLSRLDIFFFKTKHDRDFRILLCVEGHPAERKQRHRS
jgi:hypothetical protein